MKKALLLLYICFSTMNYSVVPLEPAESDTRDYEYSFYTNSNNYVIQSQEDIQNAIYNGLNEGQTIITMECNYSNYEDCLNDFYTVYKNHSLMNSINNYVSPYHKYASKRYQIHIIDGKATIEITMEKKYTEEQIKEIEEKIEEYFSEYDFSNMSDREKVKWAHDFLISRNTYDEVSEEGNAYSAYGALVENKAVCLGYTEAMALLLDRFHIPNIMISSGIHIWNLVYVDGEWLHVDTTFDDPILSNGEEVIRYQYYLVTTEELSSLDQSENHTFNLNYYSETL